MSLFREQIQYSLQQTAEQYLQQSILKNKFVMANRTPVRFQYELRIEPIDSRLVDTMDDGEEYVQLSLRLKAGISTVYFLRDVRTFLNIFLSESRSFRSENTLHMIQRSTALRTMTWLIARDLRTVITVFPLKGSRAAIP